MLLSPSEITTLLIKYGIIFSIVGFLLFFFFLAPFIMKKVAGLRGRDFQIVFSLVVAVGMFFLPIWILDVLTSEVYILKNNQEYEVYNLYKKSAFSKEGIVETELDSRNGNYVVNLEDINLVIEKISYSSRNSIFGEESPTIEEADTILLLPKNIYTIQHEIDYYYYDEDSPPTSITVDDNNAKTYKYWLRYPHE